LRKSSPNKRATLVDVARAAGVGPMTVSRTINGHPYVSNATAKRVQAAIRRLGYRPNQAARILTGQLSKSIGLIVPAVSDSFFSVISHAVQQTAQKAGYVVWLAVSDGDPIVEAAQIEQMTNHPVDGILIAPANSRSKHLKTALAGSTPIVTIDRPIENGSTDAVGVENRAGAQLAVEHLIGHGYKRIVCVATDYHLYSIKLRVAAYEEHLRTAKLPCKKLVLKDDTMALQALTALFKSRERPDALFTTNNTCTIAVIQAMQKLGIRIPHHVALIGFDDVDFYTLVTPSITAVSQPVAELGRTSTRLLFGKINRKTVSTSVRVLLPPALVVRESCGCERSKEK
jgi:LacI family transcriptional regulator